ADLFHQLAGPEDRAGALGDWIIGGGSQRGRFEEAASLRVLLEQPLDPLAQGGVAAAHPVQEGNSLGGVFLLQGFDEEGLFLHDGRSHAVRFQAPYLHAPSGNEISTQSGKRATGSERTRPNSVRAVARVCVCARAMQSIFVPPLLPDRAR